MPRKTTATNIESSILKQFLAELDSIVAPDQSGNGSAMTKGQALVKSMIDEALKGDQKMFSYVLKLVEKQSSLTETPVTEVYPMATTDWHALFAFYGKYKKLIEAEIKKLKKENPDYWGFEWFRPTLESAPWYQDLYVKKS